MKATNHALCAILLSNENIRRSHGYMCNQRMQIYACSSVTCASPDAQVVRSLRTCCDVFSVEASTRTASRSCTNRCSHRGLSQVPKLLTSRSTYTSIGMPRGCTSRGLCATRTAHGTVRARLREQKLIAGRCRCAHTQLV